MRLSYTVLGNANSTMQCSANCHVKLHNLQHQKLEIDDDNTVRESSTEPKQELSSRYICTGRISKMHLLRKNNTHHDLGI